MRVPCVCRRERNFTRLPARLKTTLKPRRFRNLYSSTLHGFNNSTAKTITQILRASWYLCFLGEFSRYEILLYNLSRRQHEHNRKDPQQTFRYLVIPWKILQQQVTKKMATCVYMVLLFDSLKTKCLYCLKIINTLRSTFLGSRPSALTSEVIKFILE